MPPSPQLFAISLLPRRPAARHVLAAGVAALALIWNGAAPALGATPAEPPDHGLAAPAVRVARAALAEPAAPAAPPAQAEPASPAAPPAQPEPAAGAPPEPRDAGAPPPGSSPSGAAPPVDESLPAVPLQPAASDPVGTRLIDIATPFTLGSRRIELLITHRFNQPVNQGASAHNLWGLDSGADVGIGFTYGLLRHLDLSVYRSQFQEDFELAGKLQVLNQSPGIPLSAAVRAGADLLGRVGVQDPHRPFVQVLLGRRLAPGWNVFVSPSWVSATPLLHNAWNAPVGLTLPLPAKWSLDGEVIAANHALRDQPGASHLAWHAAFAKQIGWHLFQIVLGNSRATTVDQIVGGDFAGGFATRDLRLGFNLIRYFAP